MRFQILQVPFNAACASIRREVFVREQQVSEHLEIDGLDPLCVHFIAIIDGQSVGTCRLRVAESRAKAERVAVLPSHRGHGVGLALMEALETYAANQGHTELVLYAQESVIGFYERQGYVGHGPRFFEANIPHQAMTKPIASNSE